MGTEYSIVAKLDPSGVTQGRQQIQTELKQVDNAAASTQAALDRAFDQAAFDKSVGGLIAQMQQLQKGLGDVANSNQKVINSNASLVTSSNSATTATNALTAALKNTSAAGNDEVNVIRRRTQANDNETRSTGNLSASKAILQHVVRSTTDSFAAGLPVSMIFGEQIARLGEAAELSGGALGGVGTFLAGPWGIAVIGAVTVLSHFAGALFDTSEAAKVAEKSLKAFQDRQSDIGNFIDQTTGKLIQQNRALIQNASLTRGAAIGQNSKNIVDFRDQAFQQAGSLVSNLTASRGGYGSPGAIQQAPQENIAAAAAIQKVIDQSAGSVVKLNEGFDRLQKQIPGIAKLAPEFAGIRLNVSNLAGQALTTAQASDKLRTEMGELADAANGGTVATSKLIDRQVALATANNAVTRAQQKLDDVRAEGESLDKRTYASETERNAAYEKYRQELTSATTALQSAQQAKKDDAKATRDQAKAAREHEAELRKEAATAKNIANFLAEERTKASAAGETDPVAQLVTQRTGDFTRRFGEAALTPGVRSQIQSSSADEVAAKQQAEVAKDANDAFQKEAAILGKVGVERDIANAKIAEEIKLKRQLTPIEALIIENGVRLDATFKAEQQAVESATKAYDDYKAALGGINTAERNGRITPRQASIQRANLPANQQRESLNQGLGTGGGAAGRRLSRDSQLRGVDNTEDSQKEQADQLHKSGITSEQEYQDQITAIQQKAADDRRKIKDAETQTQLDSAQSLADSLVQIAQDTLGKNNAIYKAAFAASKAVAIAKSVIAIQTGIAEASAEPFPANLGAIASVVAATASIISNIQQVALNLADGGFVSGPGTTRSDSIPANLSNGEFVVNAGATAQHRALLEAINSGASVQQAARVSSNDNGGGGSSGGRQANVRVIQHPGVHIEERHLTTGDVEIIAKRQVDAHAGTAAARELDNPNSRMSKSVQRNTTSTRRR